MIRGLFSRTDHEVRVKLLHRPFGAAALAGAWTAADRWFIEKTFSGDTLLLGVESDLQTRRSLASAMRGDLAITAVPGGLFRDRVREIVDFSVPVATLLTGPAFGVFWTMAAGFGPAFRQDLSDLAAQQKPDITFSTMLHDGDILGQDGPSVVLYRNFFDDETCLRLRPALWDAIQEEARTALRLPWMQVEHVNFDGETYDLGSSFTLTRDR
ncbi:MAG: hypothetical protein NWT12_05395 [Paracoccaceae bacterium]|jgi:hypothetical protein|nr:hypothetical protein [Paracoccaceae bacterium]MDP5365704.1 hypothetical protein [Paracoccaceae bacterium]